MAGYPLAALGLLWPAFLAEEVSEFSAALAHDLVDIAGYLPKPGAATEPCWITPNETALELESVQLRRFGQPGKGSILVCAPFALHAPTVTDLAPGCSLIEALQASTKATVYVTDWRSANPDRGSRGIDDYLADLNVLVDEIGESGRSRRTLPGRLDGARLRSTISSEGAQARPGGCPDRHRCG